jgi:hypothetical protein
MYKEVCQDFRKPQFNKMQSRIWCSMCGLTMIRVEIEEVIAAWNARTSDHAQTPEVPSEDARKALQSLEYWCTDARMGLGAIDGYDYRSGEEYGIRRVEIEIHKRLTASPDTSTGGNSK